MWNEHHWRRSETYKPDEILLVGITDHSGYDPNTKLLNNIKKNIDIITLKTNTGSTKFNQQGYLQDYGFFLIYKKYLATSFVWTN